MKCYTLMNRDTGRVLGNFAPAAKSLSPLTMTSCVSSARKSTSAPVGLRFSDSASKQPKSALARFPKIRKSAIRSARFADHPKIYPSCLPTIEQPLLTGKPNNCTKSHYSVVERQNKMKAITQTGFTLIELLVTLVVVAILAAVSVPGFASILAASDLNAAQEDFIQILNKARIMAMTRSTISTVSIAGNVATMTLADSSASPVTVTASNRVAINEAATYIFDPVGVATVNSVSGSTVLSASGFAGIAPRTITVSATGVVNVSR